MLCDFAQENGVNRKWNPGDPDNDGTQFYDDRDYMIVTTHQPATHRTTTMSLEEKATDADKADSVVSKISQLLQMHLLFFR